MQKDIEAAMTKLSKGSGGGYALAFKDLKEELVME